MTVAIAMEILRSLGGVVLRESGHGQRWSQNRSGDLERVARRVRVRELKCQL